MGKPMESVCFIVEAWASELKLVREFAFVKKLKGLNRGKRVFYVIENYLKHSGVFRNSEWVMVFPSY